MSQHQEPTFNLEQLTQQQSQPESKPTIKKENSYTYWVDQKNKSRVLPPEQRPQKIDPPNLVKQKSEDGRSDWNTVGTWEHRKISLSEIEKQYTERLNQWISQSCPNFKLKNVSLNGQCEVIFTRNKKTLTYEIKGKVEFQKKLEEQKKQASKKMAEEKSQSNIQSLEEQDFRSDNTSSDNSSENEAKRKPTSSKPKSKSKVSIMTFQIVDLTDHGDRDFNSKADDLADKKFIRQQSENLLSLLEEVLKGFKQK